MPHANARLTEYARHLAVQRYFDGHRVRDIAGQLGVSRTTVYKWIARFHDDEVARFIDWFTRAFEPILMTVLGVSVGLVVVLMYMPIFELAGNIN